MPHALPMVSRLAMVIPPQTGGVMDFAELLAQRIGPEVQVHRWHPDLRVDGADVLLHYSGYGYAKYGAPLQLLRWLRRHRPQMQRFGVFFHELYASGPPSSSVFWVSPLQRHVARTLARRSDFWLTNIALSQEWLCAQPAPVADLPHARMPVFSNIGEPRDWPVPKQPIALVFGGGALRTETWRAGGEALFAWAQSQGVALHDVGAPIGDATLAARMQAHGVVQHGRLEAAEVSARMAQARFGLLRYPPAYAGKSGVLAAYCAHGVVPVLLSDSRGDHDGLVEGTHFLNGLARLPQTDEAQQRMSRAAFDWYQPHRLDAHAACVAALLRAPTSAG